MLLRYAKINSTSARVSTTGRRVRYCQELWIGGAWLGGFLPIFLVFTSFDLNTINERNTSTHQG